MSLKYSDASLTKIRSGRPYYVTKTGRDYYESIVASIGPSRHYTFLFNLFVMMQLFNFVNARKLKDEMNIFEGIHRSFNFNIIIVAILFLQAVLVTHGGIAMDCYNQVSGDGGLNIE